MQVQLLIKQSMYVFDILFMIITVKQKLNTSMGEYFRHISSPLRHSILHTFQQVLLRMVFCALAYN